MQEYIIFSGSKAIYSEKGSIFTALTLPVSNSLDIKLRCNQFKIDYPDANHICYGYRIKIDNRIDEFSTDAGEPKGSSGKPILNTLKRNKLVNSAIFVIRYFGGSKLGIPGLINAYRKASMMAIEKSILKPWILKVIVSIHYKYEIQNKVDYIFKEYKINILKSDFGILIKAELEIETSKVDVFIEKLVQVSNGKMEIQIL